MDQDNRIQQGRGGRARHQNLPDSGHLYAAHVIHDIWRITVVTPSWLTDVGQHQMWEAQYFHHEHSAR